jgi:hypothetical protein
LLGRIAWRPFLQKYVLSNLEVNPSPGDYNYLGES